MSARWSACYQGTCLLVMFLFCAGLPVIGFAQQSSDLYETGPDPIAPELAPGSLSTDATGNTETQEAASDTEKDDEKDLYKMLDMDLKQLSQVAVKSPLPTINMEVTTVSRTGSTVGRSPAAVYVITNEMIKRSGARNIPEVLRLAPGVQVARITTTTWAISIRGFNARYSNKLLVQIDGRAVYTPGFGGVYWDQQQVLLEEVERIEIIRGPGASVWGANAVNGVINIVTKSSDNSQGIYAYSGGGSEHRSFNAIRAGGCQGNLNWRIYGMQADDGPGYSNLPGGALDALEYAQGGFRMDWTPTCCDTLTLQGDFLGERETLVAIGTAAEPESIRTTNFLGRWTRKLSDDTDWSAQIYYDNWKRLATGPTPVLQNQRAFDLDCQFHTKLDDHHDIVCGFGYRDTEVVIDASGGYVTFDPPQSTFDIISYFVQDTIELRPDRVFVTAGIKCEHNNFTRFEYQPTVRLLLTPDDRTTIWGAVSRAVRTPSIAERDIVILGGLLRGNKSVRSEDLLAYELGIRRQPTDRFYWDLAVFFNRYDNLIGATPILPPSVTTNNGYGDTYGYELVATYEVNPNWRLRGCYSFLVQDVTYGQNGVEFNVFEGFNPRNQCFIHSAWNLSRTTTLDMIWRYVDRLPAGVPRYFVMDVRMAWQPDEHMEVAVVGQNLLENHHLEFNDYRFFPTQVQSGVYGMVTWRR